MANKYDPNPLPPCPDPLPAAETSPCPDWSICLPFGGRLYSSKGCVYAEKGDPPADGVYGKIIIANGCLAGVEPVEALFENLAPCAEITPSCAALPASSSGSIPPSPSTGNLYQLDVSGRPLVRCTVRGGSGITVSGTGTTSDPIIISAGGIEVSPVYVSSGNDALSVTGSGTRDKPFTITHKEGKQLQLNGMVFDKYGHLVDTGGTTANPSVSAVVGGVGISAETNKVGMVTVGLQSPVRNKSGTYDIGGWTLEVDEYNRIFDIQRDINISAGTYPLGAYDVTYIPNGSVSDIALSAQGIGVNHILNWNKGGTPRTRRGTFHLRFPTALGGILYTDMAEMPFWTNLSIRLDNMSAQFQKPTTTPAPKSLMFWNYGLFGAGQHILTISSSTPWLATSGLTVHLFAISPQGDTEELE